MDSTERVWVHVATTPPKLGFLLESDVLKREAVQKVPRKAVDVAGSLCRSDHNVLKVHPVKLWAIPLRASPVWYEWMVFEL